MGTTETSETKVRHSIEEGDTPFRSDHFQLQLADVISCFPLLNRFSQES